MAYQQKTPLRQVTSGSTDSAGLLDSMIAWNSSVALAKTETIPTATNKGQTLTIKDAIGTASTYNITVSPTAGTIDYSTTFVINQNYESITIVADGNNNWMVI